VVHARYLLILMISACLVGSMLLQEVEESPSVQGSWTYAHHRAEAITAISWLSAGLSGQGPASIHGCQRLATIWEGRQLYLRSIQGTCHAAVHWHLPWTTTPQMTALLQKPQSDSNRNSEESAACMNSASQSVTRLRGTGKATLD